MKKELTDWFPANVKPNMPGWYERDWGSWSVCNDYFDGCHWYCGGEDDSYDRLPSTNKIKWRGLAEKPE